MWRRPERFPHTARFSCRRRGGVYAARERCGGPEHCGPRKFARRGTTPPYGMREHGGNAVPSAFRQTSRAACRPPLRPNGNPQFSIFVLNLRKVVGRGLDPAAGTLRQAPRFQQDARFSCRRRGGVYAARERCGGPEHCGPRKFARRGTTPPYGKREHGGSTARGRVFNILPRVRGKSPPVFLPVFSSFFTKKDRRNPLRSFWFSCYSSILPKAKSSPSWMRSVARGAMGLASGS